MAAGKDTPRSKAKRKPTATPYKSRLLPYKILGLLLYGRYLWMEIQPSGAWKVGLGPLSSILRVNPTRVREQLEWLVARNYINAVSFEHGYAYVDLRTPPNSDTADVQRVAIDKHRADALQKVRQIVEETD